MIAKTTKFCFGCSPFHAFLPYRNHLFPLVFRKVLGIHRIPYHRNPVRSLVKQRKRLILQIFGYLFFKSSQIGFGFPGIDKIYPLPRAQVPASVSGSGSR